MDYGDLVTATWRITWRNRGLWWLGFFAGSASGSCSGSSVNTGDSQSLDELMRQGGGPGFDPTSPAVQAVVNQILPVILIIGAIVLVIGLLFWLLSVACTAGIIVGGREEAFGRPVSVGVAWSRGMPAFGRLFVLELVWVLFWIVIVAVIVLIAVSSLFSQPRGAAELMRAFFSLLGVLAIVGLLGSVLSIVLAYAQRAVVIEGVGPIESLGAGFRLLRQQLGTSLLVWLIGLALAIGGGIGLVIGLIVLALPTLLVGAILGFLTSLAGVNGFVVGFGLLGLVLFIGIFVGAAAINTYIWHYWTLAYLRLTGALAPTAPPPVTPPPPPQPVPEVT